MEDLIFVNIDHPVFNIALKAVEELEGEGRLEEMNQQKAWLKEIKSAANTFTFGGKGSASQQAFHFGSTASAVFRMVMLHAVGIGNFGPDAKNTAPKFKVLEPFKEFKLFEGKNAAVETRRFWPKYDHVFPRSLIANEVLENQEKSVAFRNTMLIFRNNFTEVIIIETAANATMYPPVKPSSDLYSGYPGEIFSDVEVTCTRKKIKAGKYFEQLKDLYHGAGQEQAKPMTRTGDEVLAPLHPEDEESNNVGNLTARAEKLSVK